MAKKLNIWDILGIDKTSDAKVIKKAYLKKLKNTRPEDNPAGFMELHDAYEKALELSYYDERMWEEDYDIREWEEDRELSEEEIIRNEKLKEWEIKFREVYESPEKRFDIKCWYNILYENIPLQIKYYENCRIMLQEYFVNWYNFMPDNITRFIADFFDYKEYELGKIIYKNTKLKEIFRFDLFDTSISQNELDSFCDNYNLLYERIIQSSEYNTDILMGLINEFVEQEGDKNVFYLPFEAMKLRKHFRSRSEPEMLNDIEELRITAYKRLLNNPLNKNEEKHLELSIYQEINLLRAEYLIYRNSIKEAVKIIYDLYFKAPVKDFMYLCRLGMAFTGIGKHYEAYRCMYMYTYLNPTPEIFRLLSNVREYIIGDYEKTKKNDKNNAAYTNIQMSRIYMHNDEVFKAQDRLKYLRGRKSYKYYTALYMMVIEADAADEEREEEIYEKIMQFDKEKLSSFELIDREEIQLAYLFRKKQFNECTNRCNELLSEYPFAYNFKLMRFAVQSSQSEMIWTTSQEYRKTHWDYHCMHATKRIYDDAPLLIRTNPKGCKACIIAAAQFHGYNRMDFNKKALRLLEPVKDKCPYHYKLMELMILKDENQKKYAMETYKFIRETINTRINIPLSGYLINFFDVLKDYGWAAANIKDYSDNCVYHNMFARYVAVKHKGYGRNNESAYKMLVNIYESLGKDSMQEDAVFACKEVLKNISNEFAKETWKCERLFKALLRAGKQDEAKAIMEEEHRDSVKPPMYHWWYKYAAENDNDEKEKYLKLALKYVTVGGISDEVSIDAVEFYLYTKKEPEKALELLENCIERFGELNQFYFLMHTVYYNLAYCNENAQDCMKKSEFYLDKAYEFSNEYVNNPYIYWNQYSHKYTEDILNGYNYFKGRACLLQGKYKEAEVYLNKERDLQISGNVQWTLFYLKICYMALGKYKDATEMLYEYYTLKNEIDFVGKDAANMLLFVEIKVHLELKGEQCDTADKILTEENVKEALENSPVFKMKEGWIYGVKAVLYNFIHDYDKSSLCMEYAEEHTKKDDICWYKSIIMANRGDLEGAIKMCEEALENINGIIYTRHSYVDKLNYKRVLGLTDRNRRKE